jgi:hypothetical protein
LQRSSQEDATGKTTKITGSRSDTRKSPETLAPSVSKDNNHGLTEMQLRLLQRSVYTLKEVVVTIIEICSFTILATQWFPHFGFAILVTSGFIFPEVT